MLSTWITDVPHLPPPELEVALSAAAWRDDHDQKIVMLTSGAAPLPSAQAQAPGSRCRPVLRANLDWTPWQWPDHHQSSSWLTARKSARFLQGLASLRTHTLSCISHERIQSMSGAQATCTRSPCSCRAGWLASREPAATSRAMRWSCPWAGGPTTSATLSGAALGTTACGITTGLAQRSRTSLPRTGTSEGQSCMLAYGTAVSCPYHAGRMPHNAAAAAAECPGVC